MEIVTKKDGNKLELAVSGRLDTSTSPKFEAEIKRSIDDIKELIIDFENLDYISSSGLRILLASQKIMNGQGTMIVKNVKDSIMEIFEITGFTQILTIK